MVAVPQQTINFAQKRIEGSNACTKTKKKRVLKEPKWTRYKVDLTNPEEIKKMEERNFVPYAG
jgi:hypothetical protein